MLIMSIIPNSHAHYYLSNSRIGTRVSYVLAPRAFSLMDKHRRSSLDRLRAYFRAEGEHGPSDSSILDGRTAVQGITYQQLFLAGSNLEPEQSAGGGMAWE